MMLLSIFKKNHDLQWNINPYNSMGSKLAETYMMSAIPDTE